MSYICSWITGNPELEPRGLQANQIIRLLGHQATIGNGKRAYRHQLRIVSQPEVGKRSWAFRRVLGEKYGVLGKISLPLLRNSSFV